MEFIQEIFALNAMQFLCVAAAIFFGSVLRGITGFGFSMTLIIIMTLFMTPAQATAYILIWEILASIVHLPFVWRHVSWGTLKGLCLGVIVGTPLGVASLVYIPPNIMTFIINLTVVILGLIMLRGFRLTRELNTKEVVGTGFISGIINGASANGGPPVILMYFSSPAGMAVGRASIIAYFLFTDVWASAIFIQQGMTTLDTLWGALILLPLLVIGLWVGSKLYGKIHEEKLKAFAIKLLILASLISCTRSVLL